MGNSMPYEPCPTAAEDPVDAVVTRRVAASSVGAAGRSGQVTVRSQQAEHMRPVVQVACQEHLTRRGEVVEGSDLAGDCDLPPMALVGMLARVRRIMNVDKPRRLTRPPVLEVDRRHPTLMPIEVRDAET